MRSIAFSALFVTLATAPTAHAAWICWIPKDGEDVPVQVNEVAPAMIAGCPAHVVATPGADINPNRQKWVYYLSQVRPMGVRCAYNHGYFLRSQPLECED
jgi:hypothetical protein